MVQILRALSLTGQVSFLVHHVASNHFKSSVQDKFEIPASFSYSHYPSNVFFHPALGFQMQGGVQSLGSAEQRDSPLPLPGCMTGDQ